MIAFLTRVQTVAIGFSKFCGLFSEEEWKGFDYSCVFVDFVY